MPKSRRSSLGRQIQSIRRSLSSIARALARLAPLLAAHDVAAPGGPTPRGRTLKLSPKRRAGLKLQGRYMGYLRNLKPKEKARVKALRAAKGLRPAIAFAKRLAKG